jgi:hypothetical protein
MIVFTLQLKLLNLFSMKKFNNSYLFAIFMVSAMGGLLFGYNWVVIGGVKPFYESFFDITASTNLQARAMSSALNGCVVGAVVSGFISDKFGRKWPLLLSAFLFTVASAGTGLAMDYTIFIIFRMIGGVGIGLASALSPTYIAEVAPSHLRGRFVSLNQMTMDKAAWLRVFGISQSYGFNFMRYHSWCPPKAAFAAARSSKQKPSGTSTCQPTGTSCAASRSVLTSRHRTGLSSSTTCWNKMHNNMRHAGHFWHGGSLYEKCYQIHKA